MTSRNGKDPFVDYDAAYVLGALDPQDREAFEAHLGGCERCVRAVRELSTLPGLMVRVPEAALKPAAPPCPSEAKALLPALLGKVRRQRTVRRWSLGIGAAVLAGAAAVGVIAVPAPHASMPAGRHVAMAAMSAMPGAPVEATAAVKGVAWGTAIQVNCRYTGSGYPTGAYRLVEIDRSGATETVGTWRVLPGIRVVVQASTETPVSNLRELEIQTNSGKVVTRLMIPDSSNTTTS